MAIRLTSEGKVVLIGGKPSCVCCCTGAPTIQWDSRSASKTKCGFAEFGTASFPPKRYLIEEYSGTLVDTWYYGGGATNSYSGYEEYSSSSCSIITSSFSYMAKNGDVCSGDGFNPTYFSSDFCSGTYRDVYFQSIRVSCSDSGFYDFRLYRSAITTTSFTYSLCSEYGSGSVTITRSDEYTTDILKTNTTAALPSFPGTWSGTAGSYFDLTTNELTNTIRESKYRFQFVVPYGSCYRIDWVEDGTAKFWEYTGGGTPGDTAYSAEYTIPIPTTNRTATVSDITYSCNTCE